MEIFSVLSSSKPRERNDGSEQNSGNIVVDKNSLMLMKNNVVWGNAKGGLYAVCWMNCGNAILYIYIYIIS